MKDGERSSKYVLQLTWIHKTSVDGIQWKDEGHFFEKNNDKFGKNLKSQTGIETFHFMFSKLKQKE